MDGTTWPWVETANRDSLGFDYPPAASAGRRAEALCASDDVTDRTFIYEGRPSTQAQ